MEAITDKEAVPPPTIGVNLCSVVHHKKLIFFFQVSQRKVSVRLNTISTQKNQ